MIVFQQVVPTLKYLSRMKLHQVVGCSNLDFLPIPTTLSDYVKHCPFYDPELVETVINHRNRVANSQ